MLKAEALRGELAEIRSHTRHLAIQEVHGLIAEVVSGDEQYVEWRLGGAERGQRREHDSGEECEGKFDGVGDIFHFDSTSTLVTAPCR